MYKRIFRTSFVLKYIGKGLFVNFLQLIFFFLKFAKKSTIVYCVHIILLLYTTTNSIIYWNLIYSNIFGIIRKYYSLLIIKIYIYHYKSWKDLLKSIKIDRKYTNFNNEIRIFLQFKNSLYLNEKTLIRYFITIYILFYFTVYGI